MEEEEHVRRQAQEQAHSVGHDEELINFKLPEFTWKKLMEFQIYFWLTMGVLLLAYWIIKG